DGTGVAAAGVDDDGASLTPMPDHPPARCPSWPADTVVISAIRVEQTECSAGMWLLALRHGLRRHSEALKRYSRWRRDTLFRSRPICTAGRPRVSWNPAVGAQARLPASSNG